MGEVRCAPQTAEDFARARIGKNDDQGSIIFRLTGPTVVELDQRGGNGLPHVRLGGVGQRECWLHGVLCRKFGRCHNTPKRGHFVAAAPEAEARHGSKCPKCEELSLSKSAPLYPTNRTSTRRADISQKGHSRHCVSRSITSLARA